MKISEFPNDNKFWLVKWIDDYRAGHLGTISASVSILLQEMSGFGTTTAIWRMSKYEVQHVLGKTPGAKNQSNYNSEADRPWQKPRIHAGSIPLLRVGQIYHNQTHVATLPLDYANCELSITSGDASFREVAVATQAEKPSNWEAPVAYTTLNDFELRHVSKLFPKSRCWVITEGNIDYYIPHQLVFQTFYAPHSELANAFTSGAWYSTKHTIVHASPLPSGLLTTVDAHTGAYHIVLERHVPDEFARLVAMLYFEPFAVSCAALIYTRAFADRHDGGTPSWFASAAIPYRSGERVRLVVSGYSLRKWDAPGVRQKVLVTSIVGASPPSYLPEIYWERVNSGLAGVEKIEVDAPAPYPKPSEESEKHGEQAGDDTALTSESDANGGPGTQKASFDTFSWIDAPALKKLTKSVSKVYTGRIEKTPPAGPEVSTGNKSNDQGTVRKLEASSVVRERTLRFEHLMEALDTLKKTEEISDFRTVQPCESNQIAHRGGRVAWSVLQDAERESGRWPNRGWRILRPGVLSEQHTSRSIPRTVLIVEVELKSNFIYWIEIECRATEGGYFSPVFAANHRLESLAFKAVVERLATNEGRYQNTDLRDFVRTTLNAKSALYKHQYANKVGGPLENASIVRVLKRVAPA